QWPALQLACQSAAIAKVFMQATGEHRQHASITGLACCAEGAVQPTTRNPVMVDQRERFIRDHGLEPILGRAGACNVCCPSLCRNVVDPMPAQCVIVDLKFSGRSFDRCARCEKPLNPHTLKVVAPVAAPCPRTFFSSH